MLPNPYVPLAAPITGYVETGPERPSWLKAPKWMTTRPRKARVPTQDEQRTNAATNKRNRETADKLRVRDRKRGNCINKPGLKGRKTLNDAMENPYIV